MHRRITLGCLALTVVACASEHEGASTPAAGGSGGQLTTGEPVALGGDGNVQLGGSAGSSVAQPVAGAGGEAGAGTDEPGSDAIGVFVAQGHLARTVVSCDLGQSWIGDRADVTDDRCWTDNGIECDHQATAGRGIVFGGGFFFATFGWGQPGSIRRSPSGFEWESVLEGSNFGGVAYGFDDVLLAGARRSAVSVDAGDNWDDVTETSLAGYNVRRVGYGGYEDGRFVLVADDSEISLSSDGGLSWWNPENLPAGCGEAIQTEGGIVYGNDTLVVLGGTGDACASTDGGVNWVKNSVGGDVQSHLVFDGSEFFAWRPGTVYRSADGVEWSSASITPNINIGPVAFGDGVFVAVRGGWNVWYEDQEFYRSEDGVNWQVLADGQFTGGHPIRAMTFGKVAPELSGCP